MRQTLSNFLNEIKDRDVYLLHDDLFHFKTFNSYNLGITEPTIVTIACGLASQGKHIIIYSLAGFTLYRAFDQIKFYLSHTKYTGNVIFCNAGGGLAINCYPKYMGESHRIRDDYDICKLLNLNLYTPNNKDEFLELLKNKLYSETCFIRLGIDGV